MEEMIQTILRGPLLITVYKYHFLIRSHIKEECCKSHVLFGSCVISPAQGKASLSTLCVCVLVCVCGGGLCVVVCVVLCGCGCLLCCCVCVCVFVCVCVCACVCV